jgi:hypothetical protein
LQPRQPKSAAFGADILACRRGFSLGNIHLRPESKLPPRSPLARELFREGREAGNGTISGLSCLAHRTPFEMAVPPGGQILVDVRELFRGEGEAGMSTFSRPVPARVRSSGGDAPDPSQAIIAASALSCCRATAVPQTKHFPTQRGDDAEGCKSLHLTAKEAGSRFGLMKLRANGINRFDSHVSQPQDGPERVKISRSGRFNERRH